MGRGGGDNPAPAVFACCTLSWIICSCFLLGFSFDTLEPNRMGLLYNENTCYLDTGTLYNQEEGDSGRWFTGLGQAFIEFPRAVMSIKFNSEEDASGPTISAKTYTGTSVALDMAFQFQLIRTPEAVAKVHATFGTDFARFYMKVRHCSRSVGVWCASHAGVPSSTHAKLCATSSPITWVRADQRVLHCRLARCAALTWCGCDRNAVTDLWEKREIMGTAMRDALNLRLSEKWAEVTGFQVLSLTIPTEIQSAIEVWYYARPARARSEPHRATPCQSTSVAFQKIGEARFEKEAATVRAETRRAVVRMCVCVSVSVCVCLCLWPWGWGVVGSRPCVYRLRRRLRSRCFKLRRKRRRFWPTLPQRPPR